MILKLILSQRLVCWQPVKSVKTSSSPWWPLAGGTHIRLEKPRILFVRCSVVVSLIHVPHLVLTRYENASIDRHRPFGIPVRANLVMWSVVPSAFKVNEIYYNKKIVMNTKETSNVAVRNKCSENITSPLRWHINILFLKIHVRVRSLSSA